MPGSQHITLSQLQQNIREVLSEGLPGGLWVVAEIAEMKVNSSSGHCYLELVEKGGANGIPKARVSATIWRNTYGILSAGFKGATGRDLETGMKVLLRVAVVYHELYGLSLNVGDIDPMYTLGDMERQRQETIAQLVEDGVFDLNRELEMPAVAHRLAVISSPNAAGWQDFMNELDSGGYRFEVTLFEALMQGHAAEDSIIAALGCIAERQDDFDAVVIIRGGGARSDLGFLDSYLLNFHIAQFPLPVIAGLGHDKDRSVLDMVATLSLKTPTAVAGYLVQTAAELDAQLVSLEDEINASADRKITEEKYALQQMASSLAGYASALTHRVEMGLQRLCADLSGAASNRIARQSARLDSLGVSLADRAYGALRSEEHRLQNSENTVELRDPRAILAMGFAIVRKEGTALRSGGDVRPGDMLDIELHEGNIKAIAKDNGKES